MWNLLDPPCWDHVDASVTAPTRRCAAIYTMASQEILEQLDAISARLGARQQLHSTTGDPIWDMTWAPDPTAEMKAVASATLQRLASGSASGSAVYTNVPTAAPRVPPQLTLWAPSVAQRIGATESTIVQLLNTPSTNAGVTKDELKAVVSRLLADQQEVVGRVGWIEQGLLPIHSPLNKKKKAS